MKKDSPEPRPPPHRSRSLGSAPAAAAAAAMELVAFPSRASTSAVPFAWEQRPGIPKPSGNLVPPSPSPRSDPLLLLPLPPPLRPGPLAPRRRRSAATSAAADPDPFAAALAECAKEPPPRDTEEIWWSAAATAAAAAARRRAAAERLGFMGGMYGSCKAGCSVVESAVHVPRSGIRTVGYGIVNRR